jgi:hypothetical protein
MLTHQMGETAMLIVCAIRQQNCNDLSLSISMLHPMVSSLEHKAMHNYIYHPTNQNIVHNCLHWSLAWKTRHGRLDMLLL